MELMRWNTSLGHLSRDMRASLVSGRSIKDLMAGGTIQHIKATCAPCPLSKWCLLTSKFSRMTSSYLLRWWTRARSRGRWCPRSRNLKITNSLRLGLQTLTRASLDFTGRFASTDCQGATYRVFSGGHSWAGVSGSALGSPAASRCVQYEINRDRNGTTVQLIRFSRRQHLRSGREQYALREF